MVPLDGAPETDKDWPTSAVVAATQELPIAVVVVAHSQDGQAARVNMFT